jgi:hypothetical protein
MDYSVPVLRAQNVAKSFKGVAAVKSLDLTLHVVFLGLSIWFGAAMLTVFRTRGFVTRYS